MAAGHIIVSQPWHDDSLTTTVSYCAGHGRISQDRCREVSSVEPTLRGTEKRTVAARTAAKYSSRTDWQRPGAAQGGHIRAWQAPPDRTASSSAGTVYIGATNEVTFEPRHDTTIAEFTFLTTCAVRQVRRDLNGANILKVQVGNRPVAIDSWPLIGPTSVAGLWIATGTYRDGLHLSWSRRS